jgi:TonB family protein
MAVRAQALGWDKPSRRRVPRYQAQVPLDVTVLRSGIPDTLPGRAINFCERGIAAVLAGELIPGETVGMEIRLEGAADPLRTRALVRHHDRLCCGMEFLGLSNEQHAAIRGWAIQMKSLPESAAATTTTTTEAIDIEGRESSAAVVRHVAEPRGLVRRWRGRGWIGLLIVVTVLLCIFWWRWNRGWKELESGLTGGSAALGERPKAHVPAEEMERLLIHRVEPRYPETVRGTGLQGVIALDVVVGRDGSVLAVNPLNGPEVLARSAMDALRWWKFKPYNENGEPIVVETTLAVEFKP